MIHLSHLHKLLFGGFDELYGRRLLSLHPSDQVLFKVRPIPLDLAAFIRDNDPAESKFHVEFFPKHAELWEATSWRESVSRRIKLAGLKVSQPDPILDLRHELEHELISHFRQCSLNISLSRAMAEQLIGGQDNPSLLQLAGLSPSLSDKLRTYRSLINDNNSQEAAG